MNQSIEIYRSRINKVIDYIRANLENPILLEDLASVAHFSPFHFHRIFVAVMGETVSNYTNRARNERAARLLRFSNQSLTEISIECGFSSTATFSRAFKQYFEITPKGYRDGQTIKNSKICKDLFPISTYHCGSHEQGLEDKFPVDIRQLPETTIAYIRVSDAFKEGVVINAFDRLIDWSRRAGLYDSGKFFGMSLDDPEVTPKHKYQYEVCITIPRLFKVAHDSSVDTKVLPKCRYATTPVSGDITMVSDAINYLFDHWLINSGYECELQPARELFLDKENICNWEHFDLEIMIPIKPLARGY